MSSLDDSWGYDSDQISDLEEVEYALYSQIHYTDVKRDIAYDRSMELSVVSSVNEQHGESMKRILGYGDKRDITNANSTERLDGIKSHLSEKNPVNMYQLEDVLNGDKHDFYKSKTVVTKKSEFDILEKKRMLRKSTLECVINDENNEDYVFSRYAIESKSQNSIQSKSRENSIKFKTISSNIDKSKTFSRSKLDNSSVSLKQSLVNSTVLASEKDGYRQNIGLSMIDGSCNDESMSKSKRKCQKKLTEINERIDECKTDLVISSRTTRLNASGLVGSNGIVKRKMTSYKKDQVDEAVINISDDTDEFGCHKLGSREKSPKDDGCIVLDSNSDGSSMVCLEESSQCGDDNIGQSFPQRTRGTFDAVSNTVITISDDIDTDESGCHDAEAKIEPAKRDRCSRKKSAKRDRCGKKISMNPEECVVLHSDSDGSSAVYLGEDMEAGDNNLVLGIHDLWHVDEADRWQPYQRRGRYFVECRNCRMNGHTDDSCPHAKKRKVCLVCGLHGHMMRRCPLISCRCCLSPGSLHTTRCGRASTVCKRCHFTGHPANACPDLWRRYHATTTQGCIVPARRHVIRKQCCNCGSSNHKHLYHECRRRRMYNNDIASTPLVVSYKDHAFESTSRQQEPVASGAISQFTSAFIKKKTKKKFVDKLSKKQLASYQNRMKSVERTRQGHGQFCTVSNVSSNNIQKSGSFGRKKRKGGHKAFKNCSAKQSGVPGVIAGNGSVTQKSTKRFNGDHSTSQFVSRPGAKIRKADKRFAKKIKCEQSSKGDGTNTGVTVKTERSLRNRKKSIKRGGCKQEVDSTSGPRMVVQKPSGSINGSKRSQMRKAKKMMVKNEYH